MKSPRTLVLLPRRARITWSPQAFVEELPNVARSIVELRFGAHARAVLDAHMLTPRSTQKSVAAVSRELGISKQAGHQTLRKIIRRLREAMLEERYRMCISFRLRPGFSRPLKELSKKLRRRSLRDSPYPQWQAFIARTWAISAAQLSSVEPLLSEILGLRRYDFSSPRLVSVGTAADNAKWRFERAERLIRKLLRSRYPASLSLKKITDAVNERAIFAEIEKNKIRTLLSSMKGVEKRGNSYRSAGSRADQYEQVLKRAGRPLHYSELVKRIRRFGFKGNASDRRSVANLVGPDTRFVRSAERGYWALAEWETPPRNRRKP